MIKKVNLLNFFGSDGRYSPGNQPICLESLENSRSTRSTSILKQSQYNRQCADIQNQDASL